MLLLLTNVLFLVLWLRLLPQRDEKTFFNPYVAGGLGVTERIVRFLQPVFGRVSPYATSTVILLFLLAFRGIVASGANLPWVETLGLWRFAVNPRSPADSLLFSFVSFGWLLHRLWTLDWALDLLRGKRRESRASAALSALSMPVSALPKVSRGAFLLLFGTGLGMAMSHVGLPLLPVPGSEIQPFPVPAVSLSGPVLLALALGTMVDVLGVASHLVMVFIVLSFVGTLLRSMPAMTIGNEGVDLVVGAFIPRPIQIGGLSFAPVVFFIVAGLVHQFALGSLLLLLKASAG